MESCIGGSIFCKSIQTWSKKTVFIYRLYYTNTVEQVVNERIERKRNIASSAVIGNDGHSQDRADILRALELIPTIRRNN